MTAGPWFNDGSQMAGAGNGGTNQHMAHGSWVFPVSAGTATRFGCRIDNTGDFVESQYYCFASFICN